MDFAGLAVHMPSRRRSVVTAFQTTSAEDDTKGLLIPDDNHAGKWAVKPSRSPLVHAPGVGERVAQQGGLVGAAWAGQHHSREVPRCFEGRAFKGPRDEPPVRILNYYFRFLNTSRWARFTPASWSRPLRLAAPRWRAGGSSGTPAPERGPFRQLRAAAPGGCRTAAGFPPDRG